VNAMALVTNGKPLSLRVVDHPSRIESLTISEAFFLTQSAAPYAQNYAVEKRVCARFRSTFRVGA
jgi:hypothetical protein